MYILSCRLKAGLSQEYEVFLPTILEIEIITRICLATELLRKHVVSWVKPLIWRRHRIWDFSWDLC